jgi:hypothetical protein
MISRCVAYRLDIEIFLKKSGFVVVGGFFAATKKKFEKFLKFEFALFYYVFYLAAGFNPVSQAIIGAMCGCC